MVKFFIFVVFVCAQISGDELYFGLKKDIFTLFLGFIDQETESIALITPKLSHEKLISSLKKALDRNVSVQIIIEKQVEHLALKELEKKGAKIYYCHSRPRFCHEFCLFSTAGVWVNSCEFSVKFRSEVEQNSLLITDRDLMKKFNNEFVRIKASTQKKT